MKPYPIILFLFPLCCCYQVAVTFGSAVGGDGVGEVVSRVRDEARAGTVVVRYTVGDAFCGDAVLVSVSVGGALLRGMPLTVEPAASVFGGSEILAQVPRGRATALKKLLRDFGACARACVT